MMKMRNPKTPKRTTKRATTDYRSHDPGSVKFHELPEYGSWSNAIQRCTNKKRKGYSSYGGRGIQVCEAWRKSFWQFYLDMGPKPTPSHTLDRYPDRNGNYAPSNCRWATPKEQSNNAGFNVLLKYKGESRSPTEWSERLGLNLSTIRNRMANGLSHADCLKPIQSKFRNGRSNKR